MVAGAAPAACAEEHPWVAYITLADYFCELSRMQKTYSSHVLHVLCGSACETHFELRNSWCIRCRNTRQRRRETEFIELCIGNLSSLDTLHSVFWEQTYYSQSFGSHVVDWCNELIGLANSDTLIHEADEVTLGSSEGYHVDRICC